MPHSPETDIFPSPEDTRVHKIFASRRRNEKAELNRRLSEIETPEELVAIILEIAGKKYRQGNRIINFVVEVPIQSFQSWATSSKIASQDMDQYDRQSIRKELTEFVRSSIKPRLTPGNYVTIDSGIAGGQRLSFKMKFILKPTSPRPTP